MLANKATSSLQKSNSQTCQGVSSSSSDMTANLKQKDRCLLLSS